MGYIIGGTTLIAIIVLYFAIGYPSPEENVVGTIGGVEKAKKYQKEQITNSDVELEISDVHT